MIRSLKRRSVPPGPPLPGLHPVLDRVYRARGVSDPAQLTLSLSDLLPPETLSGLEAAIHLLTRAVVERRHILLVGDFDADGATSVATALLALRAMGAGRCSYIVPNRFEFGYGLTAPIARMAAEQGAELLVTVDNGISSIEGVLEARRLGLQVVVTDHHLPGEVLPQADAIINPNLAGDAFPSKALAGVGVVFYLMAALRQSLRDAGWFQAQGIKAPSLADYLDLVALGTVADVVPLDRNNRILVEQGLKRIRAGRCRPGVRALLDVAGRDLVRVVASDLGFAVGPRLNAAGRLEDMSLGIECLLTNSEDAAHEFAARLDGLNRQRRDIEQQMQMEALVEVERIVGERGGAPGACLCLYDSQWHQGVVGLLASRLKEKLHRPTLVFAPAEDGSIKGSGRSIPGLHLRDAIARVDTLHPGLIDRFGGHAAAAGLSLKADKFPLFSSRIEELIEEMIDSEMLRGELLTDGPIAATDMSLSLAEMLTRSGPWGQGFPEPLFHNRFAVRSRRMVGQGHLKLELIHADDPGTRVEAIAFGGMDKGWDTGASRVELVYRLDVNRWQGRERLQLIVEELRPNM